MITVCLYLMRTFMVAGILRYNKYSNKICLILGILWLPIDLYNVVRFVILKFKQWTK